MASVHLGGTFHITKFRAGFGKPPHYFISDFRMSELAATEANRHLHLVAVAQKADSMSDLGVEISDIGIETESDLLDVYDMLVFASFLFALCLLETVFAVIHDAAYRRIGHRRNLDQIQIFFISYFLCFTRGHHSELLSVFVDDTKFVVSDLFVDLQFLNCYG
jgi:hypothetical protein